MDRLDEINAFTLVADARSFTQGARRLGVSGAQVSKLVARLENRLGARLLNRTTRDVSLTDTGRAYLARARELVAEFEALETAVRDQGGPRGLLRITAPVSFGASQLQPVLLDFAAAYPEVGLEVSFSDRAANLVDEGFDTAVRIGRLTDSSLVARKLAEVRVITCASPDYLAAHGEPQRPSDLIHHQAILDLNVRDPHIWPFAHGGEPIDVRVDGRLRFSSPDVCLEAAKAGFGVARSPDFVASADLRAGRLQVILAAFEPDPVHLFAVYPHGRHLAAKVRVFVDFLADRFKGEPAWRRGWS